MRTRPRRRRVKRRMAKRNQRPQARSCRMSFVEVRPIAREASDSSGNSVKVVDLASTPGNLKPAAARKSWFMAFLGLGD